MDRLDELKAKGWVNLSKEEREEYSSLKAGGEIKFDVKPTVKTPPVVKDDDRLSKLEKLVENLSKENSNLREETSKLQEGWGEYVPEKDKNKTATVKIYRKDGDSLPAVVTNVKIFKSNEWNEETHKYDKLVFTVTLRYDDGKEEEVKMGAVEFANLREIERVEIVKEDKRVLRKVEDYVPLPDKDKSGYPVRMLDGGSGYGQSIGKGQIPLEMFKVESTVTVKRKNGQEFQMENKFLNL